MTESELQRFDADSGFPNSTLPLLVYRGALPPDAAAMEKAFAYNGWSNSWRDGIFSYHHFHSIAHEVLGIASGQVTVAFGGPHGKEVTVRVGDVVVIPAGVAHRNMRQSDDLLVVGAYRAGPTTTSAGAIRPSSTRSPVQSRRCRCRTWIRCWAPAAG